MTEEKDNDKEAKIKRLLHKSKQIFLNEQREAMQRVFQDLLDYTLQPNRETAAKLERFFHSLHGSAATLELMSLARLGAEYEDYFVNMKEGKDSSEKFLGRLLKGLALIQQDLRREEKQECTLFINEEVDLESGTSVRSTGEEDAEDQDPVGKKKKILLIEDTQFIAHYVQGKLQDMGIKVDTAKDGEEGVRKAIIECPDLMIIDLMLPKMDGFEVCREIKAHPKTKDTKVMIMSTRKSKEDVIRCFKLGIDDYIIKPFTLEDLEERIKHLLL